MPSDRARVRFIEAFYTALWTGHYPSPRQMNWELGRNRGNPDTITGWEVQLRNELLRSEGYVRRNNRWVKP